MANLIITGASSGLGAALASDLPIEGDHVWLVSRRRPAVLTQADGVLRSWVECDLRNPESAITIKDAVGETPVDMLVHCAGIWESRGPFDQTTPSEIFDILAVNVGSFVAIVANLADSLRRAKRGWVIGIGSITGLDNGASARPAYAASKFGMRGAIHGLREVFRDSRVASMCPSIGSLAPTPQVSGSESQDSTLGRIPASDVVQLLRLLPMLSDASVIKEVSMPAIVDEKV